MITNQPDYNDSRDCLNKKIEDKTEERVKQKKESKIELQYIELKEKYDKLLEENIKLNDNMINNKVAIADLENKLFQKNERIRKENNVINYLNNLTKKLNKLKITYCNNPKYMFYLNIYSNYINL